MINAGFYVLLRLPSTVMQGGPGPVQTLHTLMYLRFSPKPVGKHDAGTWGWSIPLFACSPIPHLDDR